MDVGSVKEEDIWKISVIPTHLFILFPKCVQDAKVIIKMIQIVIKTDGKDILDSVDNKDCTLEETALVVYRLEQIKNILLDKEFDSKFEVSEDKS